MKKIVCELCGSNDLKKLDGEYECQYCGTKYSVEEAKKLIVEGKVKIDKSDDIANYIEMANNALNSNNTKEAYEFANKALETINFDEKYFDVNFERFAVDSDLPAIINELGAHEELWGQGNEVPKIHVTNINLNRSDIRVMGARQDTLKFEKNGISYIKFFAKDMIEEINEMFAQTDSISIDIVGEPSINEYMGYTNPQIMISAYQISDGKYGF